jgi:translation initiation factor 2B subunit (eIF-2B alpha/beta/delta family)/8-oxo-dGTP pyrophosphatase MutT (NUDIX family)
LFKHVVTSFLQLDEQILLLHRSTKVGSYQGSWAGVSGYLEEAEDPLTRAKIEIEEEVGLRSSQLDPVRSGEPLRVFDEEKDTVWIVHPFLFEVHEPSIRLDWEHSESKWVYPDALNSYETVPKLLAAFERVRWDLQATASAISTALQSVAGLSRDRVHGASFLGRRSIEILSETARTTDADSVEELFSDLLAVGLELRKAQPGMAIIRNLVGRFLYEAEAAKRRVATVEQFREIVANLSLKVQKEAESAAEDASRNSIFIMPDAESVLTHSYSSNVKRSVELAVKSKRGLTVYVTESSPGLEGKQLAKGLVGIGVPVRLIADSAVGSVISEVDLVLVGADSVFTNGSVVNKIGTKKIAAMAKQEGVPFYVICENSKFSTADFLGETVQIADTLFDITPRELVTKIVTESGLMEPQEVQREIKKKLSQLYP